MSKPNRAQGLFSCHLLHIEQKGSLIQRLSDHGDQGHKGRKAFLKEK